jgi:hypothetical protein
MFASSSLRGGCQQQSSEGVIAPTSILLIKLKKLGHAAKAIYSREHPAAECVAEQNPRDEPDARHRSTRAGDRRATPFFAMFSRSSNVARWPTRSGAEIARSAAQ